MPENEEIVPGNEGSAERAPAAEGSSEQKPARGRGRASSSAKTSVGEVQDAQDQPVVSEDRPKRSSGRGPKKPAAAEESSADSPASSEERVERIAPAAESTDTPVEGDGAASEEVRPKRKKRKKKKRPASDGTPEWEDIAGEDGNDAERRGPRGLNDFSRQRDGARPEGRDGRGNDNRNNNGRNGDGRGNDNRNHNRNGDGRNNGRNNNDRNQNNRRGMDNRPIGAQPKKKKAGLWPALGFALRGIALGFAREVHIAIHFAAALLALAAAWWLNIPAAETALVVLAIGGVLAAEYLNSALETLADVVHPRPNGGIAKAKDIAAGGVLLATLAAVGVGLLVFGPAFLAWAQGLMG
jgi:diacylglycerol kinase